MLQLRSESSDKPPLWLVGPIFRIGSQRDSQIRLSELEAVALELAVVDQDVTVKQFAGQVSVNGQAAEIDSKLVHEDILVIDSFKWRVFDPKSLSKANTVLRKPIVLEWHLVGMSPEIKRKKFDITKPMTIGRAPECEISLNHQQLSRKHVKLTPTPSGLLMEDLGSSNGSFVNGEKIAHTVMTSGMELRLDSLVFKIMGPVSDTAGTGSQSPEDLDATKMRGVASVKPRKAAQTGAAKPASTAAVTPGGITPSSAASSLDKSETEPVHTGASKSPMKGLLVAVLLGAAAYAAYHFYFSQL